MYLEFGKNNKQFLSSFNAITLNNTRPIKTKPYPIPFALQESSNNDIEHIGKFRGQ